MGQDVHLLLLWPQGKFGPSDLQTIQIQAYPGLSGMCQYIGWVAYIGVGNLESNLVIEAHYHHLHSLPPGNYLNYWGSQIQFQPHTY